MAAMRRELDELKQALKDSLPKRKKRKPWARPRAHQRKAGGRLEAERNHLRCRPTRADRPRPRPGRRARTR